MTDKFRDVQLSNKLNYYQVCNGYQKRTIPARIEGFTVDGSLPARINGNFIKVA
jgi:hypothetical protein